MGELGPRVGTRQLGPESWDQRAGRVVTRRGDKTIRTGKLGLENWDRRVGTIELGELGPGVDPLFQGDPSTTAPLVEMARLQARLVERELELSEQRREAETFLRYEIFSCF